MSKRLKIAKQLLSDRGVIFISIDDNEQAQLKLLCDEVFGENNFIAKFDWRKKTGANDAKDIAIITESILLYSISKVACIEQAIWTRDTGSIDNERYKYVDEYFETRGRFYYDTLDRGGLQYSDSMNYGIEMPDGKILFPNGRSEFRNDGWIWKWGKDKVKWGLENKFLDIVKSKKNKHTQYTIKYKVYEKVDNEGKPRKDRGRAYINLITEPINQHGNLEMTELFDGYCPFSNPKPVGLIKYLLKTVSLKELRNLTILDFFAGSGTTLHATMQLNKEDGGKRQCILVTNNESNICEEVTYVRNKRVIEGYTTPKGEHAEGLTDNNLRYYKTELLPREQTVRNKRRLMEAATDLLCIKNDMYAEVNEFGGKAWNKRSMRCFAKGGRTMLVIYNELLVDEVATVIRDMDVDERIMIYVFSMNRYPQTDNFCEVLDKVELCALPAAIYDAYKNVLPSRERRKKQEYNVEQNND